MNQMVSMVGPLSHLGHGMHTGMSMENGMGMLRDGDALAEEFGPSLGRDIGESARRERAMTHLVGSPVAPQQQRSATNSPPGQNAPQPGHEDHAMSGPGGDVMYPVDDPEKKQVPGYPQDMWMDMSNWIPNKAEFHGLRQTWDRAMMGMMTLVRVLPNELYDQIMEMKSKEPEAKEDAEPEPPGQHKH